MKKRKIYIPFYPGEKHTPYYADRFVTASTFPRGGLAPLNSVGTAARIASPFPLTLAVPLLEKPPPEVALRATLRPYET